MTDELPLTNRERTVFKLTVAAVVGSLIFVSPAAAQASNGGLCGTALEDVFNALMQLALYGGFAAMVLSYVGTNALMSLPGVGQEQEESLKRMQSKALSNGVKIFAVPVIIVAINSITSALPIANCINLVPFTP